MHCFQRATAEGQAVYRISNCKESTKLMRINSAQFYNINSRKPTIKLIVVDANFGRRKSHLLMIKAGKFRVVFDEHSTSSGKGLTRIIASEPDLCQGNLTPPVASEPEFCRLKHKERGDSPGQSRHFSSSNLQMRSKCSTKISKLA